MWRHVERQALLHVAGWDCRHRRVDVTNIRTWVAANTHSMAGGVACVIGQPSLGSSAAFGSRG